MVEGRHVRPERRTVTLQHVCDQAKRAPISEAHAVSVAKPDGMADHFGTESVSAVAVSHRVNLTRDILNFDLNPGASDLPHTLASFITPGPLVRLYAPHAALTRDVYSGFQSRYL